MPRKRQHLLWTYRVDDLRHTHFASFNPVIHNTRLTQYVIQYTTEGKTWDYDWSTELDFVRHRVDALNRNAQSRKWK